MKRFIAVQHSYSEFLGTIEKQLENRGIGFTYFRPVTGQSLPASALQFDALWLLGGAHAPWDREHTPWLDEELRLVRAFERAQRPAVGLGYGAQLPPGVEPLAVDEGGDWIAWRLADAYALLFRPEMTPGLIEDTIMEEGRPLPDNIGEVLEQARELWPESRETTDRVLAALVAGLDLMHERRKPPVFSIRAVQE